MKNITELLGVKYPLIQGGMANIATHELAAAVSNAGGLGLIGTGGWDKQKAQDEIRKCKAITDKPFGVNIMLMNPHAADLAELVIEEDIKIVTTGAGNPGIYMSKWKEAGIKVIPVVPSVSLAKRMQRIGADAVIVEGTEAGGHVGDLTTMALVPQVVDAVDIPVIAAGGIADSRQVVAAMALGATGIQVGTALLVAEECPIHINYKDRIVSAKDTDTVVTGRKVGAPVRIIKNQMSREYIKLENEGATLHDLEHLTLGALRKAVLEGDVKTGSVMAGQVSGMLNEIKPVKSIIEGFFADYQTVVNSIHETLGK